VRGRAAAATAARGARRRPEALRAERELRRVIAGVVAVEGDADDLDDEAGDDDAVALGRDEPGNKT
jgi:hypothetical protein